MASAVCNLVQRGALALLAIAAATWIGGSSRAHDGGAQDGAAAVPNDRALAPADDAPALGEGAPAISELVPDFFLPEITTERAEARVPRRVSLWSQGDGRATVVGLLDRRDANWRFHLERATALARSLRSEGLRVLLIDPLPLLTGAPLTAPDPGVKNAEDNENPENLALLADPTQVVARRLALRGTLEVLVLDQELRLRYRGSELAADEPATASQPSHLAAVVAAILAGQPPPEGGRELGLPVVLDAPAPKVDYARQIGPLVRARCAECHRAGGSAPMDLTDYDEAKGWAPAMAEVTAKGIMPPWSADARYGLFKNARRLTDTEKEWLRLFAEQGAPRGEPSVPTLPVARAAELSWTIGEPDLLLQLPAPIPVPAEGVLPYQSAVIHTGTTQECWIEAFECRPTAPQVTHHAVILLVPDGVSDEQAAELSPTFQDALVGGYVPGAPAIWFPPGCARRLPKGARLVCSLHYTPNGKPAVDQSRIGIRFARGPVQHEVHGGMLGTTRIDIAPGAADVKFYALQKIEKPIDLLSFQAHMHARGAGFRYELVRDGRRRPLLDITPFDWNWQHYYELERPLRLEPGDLLVGIATYDNSTNNPRNPDPTQRVVNGQQSWDEMMNGYYHYIEPDAPSPQGDPPTR